MTQLTPYAALGLIVHGIENNRVPEMADLIESILLEENGGANNWLDFIDSRRNGESPCC